MKNSTYTIKNFRVFDEQGATFEMAPVTILTGCNSSGKSSVTKSLMLLNPLMHKIKEDIQTDKFGGFSGFGFASYDLDFTRGKHKLGTFEKVLNWYCPKEQFSISYSYLSWALDKWMDVRITFGKKKADNEELSLRSQIDEVEISCEGKVFYHYTALNETPSTERGVAHINLGSWKNELIKGLRTLENGFLCKSVLDDARASQEGYGYATFFQEGDWESIQSEFGDQTAMLLCVIYDKLKTRIPLQIGEFCKKFKWENCIKRKDDKSYGEIDWENSKDTYDFSHPHFFPLGKLMDEMDSIAKDAIESFAQECFIDRHEGEWYNNLEYRECIHNIFAEYIHSTFEKFSDFYTFYENAYLDGEFVYFGTECDKFRTRTEGHEGLKYGTACDKELVGFSGLGDKWENLSNSQKFYRIFWCLQREGGYSDSSVYGGPEISFDHLNVIREFAVLACSEALTTCDLLSDSEFIEIDRANTQRMYSFSEQGTAFNALLDEYYNRPQIIKYNKDYYDYKWSPKEDGSGPFKIDESFYDLTGGRDYKKGSFFNEWLLKLTGLNGFDIQPAPEGVGYYVKLQKSLPSGDTKSLALADLGFGTTPLVSMLLRIELILCRYLSKPEHVTICVEEPESNLHPCLQSQLADVFADAVKRSDGQLHFILETHSEYLVRKTQVLVAQKAKEENWSEQDLAEKCPFKVYYLARPEDAKPPYDMGYQLNGKFKNKFGRGFLDVADSLYLELI